ncbi:DNA methyltransferase [Sphingobacterium sp. 18053]|uniref:DNA methyltransferase n=1 Tax=Sphingobacterium sp. 18053 TaxID=2681401 RepID=UPI0013578613|nr:DNA methyltransferase [Sphingobacterium sp. 18053]
MNILRKKNNATILNPKRNKTEDLNFYSYYAGFSNHFATELIKSSQLEEGSIILDPWNGSGTTIKSSTICEIQAIGIDLNPVMVVIAKGNSLHKSEFSSIRSLFNEICKKSLQLQKGIVVSDKDPLQSWFSKDSIINIRAIEISIKNLLVQPDYINKIEWINNVSCIASFFYIVLFRTLHHFITPFKTSNPTWIKKAKLEDSKINVDLHSLLNFAEGEIEKLINIGTKDNSIKRNQANIYLGSSTKLDLFDNSIDFVLTSPPYCTRIDYAIATSLELAILDYDLLEQNELRRKLIGTSTVPKKPPIASEEWGDTCNLLLKKIENHDSKASKSYYLKNHLQYFNSLALSIKEISRVLKYGAKSYLVVQDSFYKDIYNDLAQICIEMGYNYGLHLDQKVDFPTNQSMVGINKKTKIYRRTNNTTESVLCFIKQN